MKKYKRLIAIVIACMMALSLASCGEKDSAATTTTNAAGGSGIEEAATVAPVQNNPDRGENKLKLAAPSGSGGLAFLKLEMDRSYAYNLVSKGIASSQAAEMLKNNEVSVAAVTLEDAAKLSAQTDIRILAINAYLKLTLLQKGESITEISQINGKTIYATGQGTYIQYFIEEIVADNLFNCEIIYLDSAELAKKAKAGEIEFCIMPEPEATAVATDNEEVKRVLDFTALSKKDFSYVQNCIVARADYIEKNPEIIKEFLTHIETNSNFIKTETGAMYSAEVFTNNGYYSNQMLALNAINAGGTAYVEGEEMKGIIEKNLNIIGRANPETPALAEDVYYIA